MKRLTLIIIFVSLIMIFANTFANIVAIEKGDNPKNFSDFYPRAIAVDASGHPHIVYGGDHLYYTYYDGTSWRYETVDKLSDVGKYASLALDTSGKAHISYYDNTNGDLKYATNSSGDWTTVIVDNSGGEYTSIALDRAGKAHISYYSGFLWYATNASGPWITESVDSGIIKGEYNSIALDKSGNAYISYYLNSANDFCIAKIDLLLYPYRTKINNQLQLSTVLGVTPAPF